MNFKDVWSFCQENKRLVPEPRKWQELYDLLTNTEQKSSGGYNPPLPLILAAWHHTLPIEKQLRFKEHILWADKEEQLDEIYQFLKNLDESQWVHFDET